MIYTFVTGIISGIAALFYPSYACYKLLSRRPCPEELLEKWLMYWAVLGSCFAIEVVAHPILVWIPFYHTFRMIFLICLAVNDGHLASFIYAGVLVPFLAEHEQLIDQNLAAIKPQITEFARDTANRLWRFLQSYLAAEAQREHDMPPMQPQAPPPTMADPVSGPAAAVWGLVRQYAPVAVAGLATAFSAPAPAPPTTGRTGAPVQGYSLDEQTVRSRRAQLEAELAALASGNQPLPPNPPQAASSLTSYFASLPRGATAASTGIAASPANVPLPAGGRTPYDNPPAAVTGLSPGGSPAASVRSRTPYDSEEDQRGYDVMRKDEAEPFVGGFVAPGQAPPMVQRQSWWGWARGGPAQQGYEKVGDAPKEGKDE